MVRPLVLSVLLLSATAAAATAQTGRPQPGAAAGASVTVPQLSLPGDSSAQADDQVSGAPPVAARRGRSDLVSAPAQVSEGRRTAEAAPALSTRAEGRRVRVGAVGGHDRCDVAAGAARPPECATAIETRAGDYGKPSAAPVTPEARLLILSQPQGPLTPADDAARRLGAPDVQSLAGAAADQLAAAIDAARTSAPNAGGTTGGGTSPGPPVVTSPH